MRHFFNSSLSEGFKGLGLLLGFCLAAPGFADEAVVPPAISKCSDAEKFDSSLSPDLEKSEKARMSALRVTVSQIDADLGRGDAILKSYLSELASPSAPAAEGFGKLAQRASKLKQDNVNAEAALKDQLSTQPYNFTDKEKKGMEAVQALRSRILEDRPDLEELREKAIAIYLENRVRVLEADRTIQSLYIQYGTQLRSSPKCFPHLSDHLDIRKTYDAMIDAGIAPQFPPKQKRLGQFQTKQPGPRSSDVKQKRALNPAQKTGISPINPGSQPAL